MKKNLLFIFIIFSIAANAQTSVYHPFADSGAVWVMRWTNACTMTPCILNCTSDYQYRIDGDTIISSVTYKKVIKEGYTVSNCTCVMNVPSCSGSTYYSSFYLGIRDDVPNRRAYINDGINPEELFFDFNLQVGDTIHNRYCGPAPIIYLDSVMIGSSYRKAYMFPGNARIIEGIGYFDGSNFDGPFEGCGACVCNDVWALQCYKLNGVTLLGDTSCSLLITSVPEKQNDNFTLTLSPNPVTNELVVANHEFPAGRAGGEDKSELTIFNAIGEKVFSQEPKANSQKQFNIDMSFLSPGIYFLQLTTEKGIKTAKFVKSAGF